MDQKLKRVVNAFVVTFAGVLLIQAINSLADITNAIQGGDWNTVKALAISAVTAAVVAGLRALQSYTAVPSPEPEENP